MQDALDGMMDADMALYERILDTPGFAFHFNNLCRLAGQHAALVAACKALLNAGSAPEWPERAITQWDNACRLADAALAKTEGKSDMEAKHPIQPLYVDGDGVTRFKGNAIVRMLLETARSAGVDLNTLAGMPFSNEDREQFAQLIGYSLGGFGELSYVSEETYTRAEKAAEATKGGT
jgi:hypothetical protein